MLVRLLIVMAELRRRGRSSTVQANRTVQDEVSSEGTDSIREEPPKSVPELIESEKQSAALFSLATSVIAFFFVYLGTRTQLPQPGVLYAVMIDAGSTGTRAQIFAFRNHEQQLSLVNTRMFHSKQKLAALGFGIGSADDFFKPLLEDVRKVIPSTKRRTTVPIALRATAGLRSLGFDIADTALTEARSALRRSGFLFEDDWASVLDEDAEAVGAWATANFLLGTLKDSQPNQTAQTSSVGIIELGGASLQYAFEATDIAIRDAIQEAGREMDAASNANNMQSVTPPNVVNLAIHSEQTPRKVMSKSHLGMGLLDFTKKLYFTFDREGVLEEGNPCFRRDKVFRDKPLRLGIKGSEESRKVNITGDGDFERCVASVEIAMAHYSPLNTHYLKHARETEFYAYAYIYDRTVRLGLPERPTKELLIAKGKELCESTQEYLHGDFDEACAHFSYVFVLLRDITNNFSANGPKFRLVQYVDGHMLGWALGTVLQDFRTQLAKQLEPPSK